MINKKLDEIFDRIYKTECSVDDLIIKLKENGLSQGETHIILYKKLKNRYTFSELRSYIVYSSCWSDSLKQNISLYNEFDEFLKEE